MTVVSRTSRHDARAVRESARGHWPLIFDALGIEVGTGKHRPCPACGGRDRFRFDNKDGRGSWFCNQCAPHAGDGFTLIQNVRHCSFSESLHLVAGIVGLNPQATIDRAALDRARRQREHEKRDRERQGHVQGLKIDVQREADRLIRPARGVDISRWSPEQLDAVLNKLADAYDAKGYDDE